MWFVYLIERKLDPDTNLSWAIHKENVESFSTYKDLLSFLECRITSLKTLTPLKSPNDTNAKKAEKLSLVTKLGYSAAK